MKTRTKRLFTVLFLMTTVIFTFQACKDAEKEQWQFEKAIREEILLRTNKACKNLTLTKEAENQYLGDIEFANYERMQIVIKGDIKSFTWRETINSQVARDIGIKYGQRVIELKLNPIDSLEFLGKVGFATGDTIQIMAHKEYGWYPVNELNNMKKVARYHIQAANFAPEDSIITLSLEPSVMRDGTREVVDPSRYTGKLDLKSGRKYNFSLYHSGTQYEWKLLDDKFQEVQVEAKK